MDKQLNKTLYKILIIILKYMPSASMIFQVLGLILNYFGISVTPIAFLGGSSLIYLILMFIISYVFQFCNLHRIPLIYITLVLIINGIDSFIGIPICTLLLFKIHFIIGGIFIGLFIYYIYKNRNKKSEDPIIGLYNRYCNRDCTCTQEV